MAVHLEALARLLDLGGEALLVGKSEAVLAGEDLARQAFEGVAGDGLVLLRAEDQADGRVLARLHPVIAGIVEVEVHLAGIGVGELADLEVDDDQAPEPAVEEEEVDPVPLVTDAQAALAADEGELAAEFQQEGLEMVDERLL